MSETRLMPETSKGTFGLHAPAQLALLVREELQKTCRRESDVEGVPMLTCRSTVSRVGDPGELICPVCLPGNRAQSGG